MKTSRLQVAPRNSSSVLSSSDSKIHVANYLGCTWERQDSGGPYFGPVNLTIREILTAIRRLDNPISKYQISSSVFPVNIWNPPGGEYEVYLLENCDGLSYSNNVPQAYGYLGCWHRDVITNVLDLSHVFVRIRYGMVSNKWWYYPNILRLCHISNLGHE